MSIPWGEIATGSMAGFAIGWRIYDGIKEKKLSKKYELDENPTRCNKHEVALARLDERVEHIEGDIREIKMKINAPYPQGNHA